MDVGLDRNEGEQGERDVGGAGEAASTPEGRTSFRYYSSCLLLVLGLSLIGLFAAVWIQNVIVQKNVGGFVLDQDTSNLYLWRILASAINIQYLYAIIGIALCLLAIHLVGRRSWYRAVPVFVLFAALNAVILIVGFLGLAFVLDWGSFWSPYYFSSALTIINLVVEVSVFIAIIVVEMPYLSKMFRNLYARKEQDAGLVEE